jgi:hypothetical protein
MAKPDLLTLRKLVGSGLLALATASTAGAQATAALTPAPADEPRTLETVVVSGLQSGPGLWKVSKGDNVLWILGTVAPVPKKMQWYSPQAETALAQSQELIGAPGFSAKMSMGGMFKAAFAMPTIMRARRNPDDKTLREVLPADLYARWLPLKARYLGEDDAVEEWRPIFAAGELYKAAIKDAGLQFNNGTDERIEELADKYKLKRTSTKIHAEITEPKKLAKSFANAAVDDIACFRSVLDRLDVDVNQAAQLANAWAVGYMPELTRLSRRVSVASCLEAIAKTDAMRSLGMADAKQRSHALWMKAVDAALANNKSSFATLPVSELLEAGGLWEKLQAKGYTLQVPP